MTHQPITWELIAMSQAEIFVDDFSNLHREGKWIKVDGGDEPIWKEAKSLYRKIITCVGEKSGIGAELFIHDHRNFGDSEMNGFESVKELIYKARNVNE